MHEWGVPVEFREECECGNLVRRPVPTLRDVVLDEKEYLRVRCRCGRIVRTNQRDVIDTPQVVPVDG